MPTMGHIVRMDDGAPAKELSQWDVKDNRRRARPKLRCKDQVVKKLKQHGVNNWRSRAEDRLAWRGIIKEAQSQVGLYGRKAGKSGFLIIMSKKFLIEQNVLMVLSVTCLDVPDYI